MGKRVPMRQCVGCGLMKSKKEMMRVLKTTDNHIVLDVTGKMNGRGAYLCRDAECVKKAGKNRGIERSLKMARPAEMYENIEKEFAKD